MTAETDLSLLLATMDPEVRPGRYDFVTVAEPEEPHDIDVLASVTEPEGTSIVTAQDDADRAGLAYDYVAGWITLRVHSALEAVGLTAAVSTALAEAGISCNVIAGFHHDHLLVPAARVRDALALLQELSRTSATSR